MIVISANTEPRLVDHVRQLKGELDNNYGIVFNLSKLQDEFKSEFQVKIAINVLNGIFRTSKGTMYLCKDLDIIIIYQENDRSLIDKAIFQLRYLFVEDPLATHEDGTENEAFCTVFDMAFQWQPFFNECNAKLSSTLKQASDEAAKQNQSELDSSDKLTPAKLVKITDLLDTIDISRALRQQDICMYKKGAEIRPLLSEIYINIAHLSKMLGGKYDLFSEKSMFRYITEILDGYVLQLLGLETGLYMENPVSININIDTILSKKFDQFCERIKKIKPSSVVFEIHVGDVFMDVNGFLLARDRIQKRGYRVCLDGLTDVSFVQINRKELGFDLAKLQWNADVASSLEEETSRHLVAAVERCGPNRIILCRCDTVHAIEYGQAMGISLFQGRYTDKLINPDSKVVN